ncbi:2OG-Fe(II) oxygenase [Gammaproteobacteria bacterium]|nr:2OG-Fe(II) oxygenase [Gammaproteobacteria bacterium]
MSGLENDRLDKTNYFVELLLQKLDDEELNIIDQWSNPEGTKTRHFVLDDLLPSPDIAEIYNAFPRNGDGFFDRASFREKKRTSANINQFELILSDITYALQDSAVVQKIASMLSLHELSPDPKLYAGGLSMMFPGDYLNPHIDNSHDGEGKLYRRLNLLYYTSPAWSYDQGGNFELWNEQKTQPVTIIAKQNRLVVMETNKTSWHSVSPVTSDRPRCCVSNYYFSPRSPDGSEYFHVTSFQGRPDQILRRAIGYFDNMARNTIAKVFKIGRVAGEINKRK